MNIYDIAKLTGYSSATVARALSGHGYCSKKAKADILALALKMDYNPNSSAKALRSNRTDRILFCIPDICNPFYFRIIEGVTKVLEENGYFLMLYPTESSIEKELKALDLCSRKYCDGIIFISFDFNATNITAVRNLKHPVVLGNRYLEQKEDDNFDYVYVDHILGMEMATKHLLERGCKNVALVIGDVLLQTSRERSQGYIKALNDSGLKLDPRYILDGEYTNDGSRRAFGKFMEEKLPVDGVVAANDLSAYGIMEYCRNHNISIPKDIKLVSFDNTDYATASNPSLTSIDMCQYELGTALASTLIERLKDGRKTVKNITINPKLIIRDSSK